MLVINLISSFFFHRFDLTEEKRYTLTNSTKKLLNGLDNNIDVEAYNNLENTYAEDYYKQYVPPYFNQMSQDTSINTKSRDELLDKLNYMIHLLEEQQDIKSGHVTEELILYSFLGVFIIFVLDSFARAGKYVR